MNLFRTRVGAPLLWLTSIKLTNNMKRGVVVIVGLFAMTSYGVSQTINPLNPNSGAPPVPTLLQDPSLKPLTPGGNMGVQGIAVDPTTMSLNEQNTSSVADSIPVDDGSGSAAVSDGKGLVEKPARMWRLRPIVSAGVVYDDNIFITETNRVSDVVFTLTGGLAFELGDFRTQKDNYLIAQYAATGFLYSVHSEQDAVDQNASLRAQYRFSKLAVQLNSSYQYLNGAEREVGNFVSRNLFRNNLNFIYDYSKKTVLDLELRQRANVYETYLNSYDYSAKVGGEYQFTPKLWLGADFVAGVTFVEESDTQVYQQIRGRMRYELTGKFTVKSSAGLEIRELEDGIRINPVFKLSLEYKPFSDTVISLIGYGDVQGSASEEDRSYLATGLELAIRQKVFSKFTLGLSVGYENDTYFSSSDGYNSGRVDNYFYLRPNVTYNFLKYLTASIFYEYRNNDSNQFNNSFYNNRVGAELGLQF